jgi:hypothetical protein
MPEDMSFDNTFRILESDAPRSEATGLDIGELRASVSDRDIHHILPRKAATNPRFDNIEWIRHHIDSTL